MATVSTFDNMILEDLKTGRQGSKKKREPKKQPEKKFSPWTKIK